MVDADEVDFRAHLTRRILNYQRMHDELRKREAELAEEFASVSRRLDSAMRLYETEFDAPFPEEAVAAEQAATPPAPPPEGPFTGASWLSAVVRVLVAAQSPLHVKEIWRRMQAGGFQTEARDPVRSVVATCVRSPALQKVGPNTYELIFKVPDELLNRKEVSSAVL